MRIIKVHLLSKTYVTQCSCGHIFAIKKLAKVVRCNKCGVTSHAKWLFAALYSKAS